MAGALPAIGSIASKVLPFVPSIIGGIGKIFGGGKKVERARQIADYAFNPRSRPGYADNDQGFEGPNLPSRGEETYYRGRDMYNDARSRFGGIRDSWRGGDYGGAIDQGINIGRDMYNRGRGIYQNIRDTFRGAGNMLGGGGSGRRMF